MKYVLIVVCYLVTVTATFAQSEKRKFRAPAWITHSDNVDIVGVSFAAFPKGVFKKDTTLARTFGIRIEPSLIAILSPLMPKSPVSTSYEQFQRSIAVPPTEIIYGINLSSGTFGETHIYGLSSSLLVQYLYRMNGVAIAGLSNMTESGNGVFISVMGNQFYKGNGVSISFGNHSAYFNGIQVGALNTINTQGAGMQLSLSNEATNFTGIQIAAYNEGDGIRGVQIGLTNVAKNFRGIQLGFWNKNDKRSLPLINWQFSN